MVTGSAHLAVVEFVAKADLIKTLSNLRIIVLSTVISVSINVCRIYCFVHSIELIYSFPLSLYPVAFSDRTRN